MGECTIIPASALYGSDYETFLARSIEDSRGRNITLVGKHCESGDVLVKEGNIQDDLVVGDLLVTPVTGAYGHSMGSNYNKVLRPAVVFLSVMANRDWLFGVRNCRIF